MSFQDILKILEDTTYHMLEAKNVHIQLEFRCSDNFMTEEHYELNGRVEKSCQQCH